jgi:hypothetical protein
VDIFIIPIPNKTPELYTTTGINLFVPEVPSPI